MKIVCHFDLKTDGRKFADGEIEFISKHGADLTPLFEESRDSISYSKVLKRIGLDGGKKYNVSMANAELRLIQGKKVLKRKALADEMEVSK